MTGSGFEADAERLQNMSAKLSESISELHAAGKEDPPLPEASTSNERVGYTLSQITRTVGSIIAGVEDIAGKIDGNKGTYRQADEAAGNDLNQTPF